MAVDAHPSTRNPNHDRRRSRVSDYGLAPSVPSRLLVSPLSRRVARRHLDKAINSLTRSRKQVNSHQEQVFPRAMLRRLGEVQSKVVGVGQLFDQFFGIRGRQL